MADGYEALVEGFHKGLYEALGQVGSEEVPLYRYDRGELFEIGQRAAQLALAPILWHERLGPMMDTAQVCEVLGVSRQAVAKKVTAGQLVALPAGRTRRFPIWQFRLGDQAEVRGEIAALVATAREVYPDVQPRHLAGWAMTPQPEIAGATPARWLETAGPIEPLIIAVRRAAAALAQ